MHGVASPAGNVADGGAALDSGDAEWATGGGVGDGEAVGNVAVWAADGGGGEVREGLAVVLPQPVMSAAPSKTATNRCAVTMERPEVRWTPARWAPHEVTDATSAMVGREHH